MSRRYIGKNLIGMSWITKPFDAHNKFFLLMKREIIYKTIQFHLICFKFGGDTFFQDIDPISFLKWFLIPKVPPTKCQLRKSKNSWLKPLPTFVFTFLIICTTDGSIKSSSSLSYNLCRYAIYIFIIESFIQLFPFTESISTSLIAMSNRFSCTTLLLLNSLLGFVSFVSCFFLGFCFYIHLVHCSFCYH